jgi:hypothetical protein
VYDFIIVLRAQQAAVTQNHDNANGRNVVQGEAPKNKRLKLDGGQAYDLSSDSTVVIA